MPENRPKEKFNAGAVSCALWENTVTTRDGHEVSVLKASIEKRYRDAAGTWKSSNSFSRHEVAQAIYCLMKAYAWMIERVPGEEDVTAG